MWFDDGIEESAYFAMQMPHDWKPQSELEPHVHWFTTGATTTVVRWAFEYSMAEIGSTFSAPTTLHSTSKPTGNLLHEYGDFDSRIDMSGVSSSSVSLMFVCRLFRDSSNAADTYVGDAGMSEFDFHYQKSRLGSTAETG